jgi:hypothetical protein
MTMPPHAQSTCSSKAPISQNGSENTESDGCGYRHGSAAQDLVCGAASFDIGSFELVRRFVEHVVTNNASVAPAAGLHAIDWSALKTSIDGARTLEQAIGRCVVIADRMSRGVLDDVHPGDSPWAFIADDPFFEFSMTDVAPDFGGESRYRTKVARRVARMLRPSER